MTGERTIYALKLLVMTGFLCSLHQCAPRTGKSLLTLFFDGVPLTDSVKTEAAAERTDAEAGTGEAEAALAEPVPSLVVHYPYAERECESCHDPSSLGRMLEPEPALCYMCHEDLTSVYPVLHGPVGGGYCTACHDPHSSKAGSLLRFNGRDLCLYCHVEKEVLKNEIHEGLEEMACSDCHNPHGGEDMNFLY